MAYIFIYHILCILYLWIYLYLLHFMYTLSMDISLFITFYVYLIYGIYLDLSLEPGKIYQSNYIHTPPNHFAIIANQFLVHWFNTGKSKKYGFFRSGGGTDGLFPKPSPEEFFF